MEKNVVEIILRGANHKLKIDSEFYKDIHWWLNCLNTFHGKSLILDNKPITDVEVDASKQASGIYHNGDWGYINYNADTPQWSHLHINYKEILSVYFACLRWGHLWQNKRVLVKTDSMVAKANLTKGST